MSDSGRKKALLAFRAAFLAITAWMAVDMLLSAGGPAWLYAAVDWPFDLICHRMAERTMSVFGVAMPMCSRCTGLWVGLSLSAAAAWPPVSIRALRIIFPIALVLMGIEVATQDLGWHPVFHPTRILTGLLVSVPFGGAIGAVVARELSG